MPDLSDLHRLADLRVTKRGISGRATEIALDYDGAARQQTLVVPDQYRIRQILHKSFLFSSAFAVDVKRDTAGRCQTVILSGAGWGHGAGLCQIGALGMALSGIGHKRIVKHYFPDAELKALYDA
jgi:SpoIID/LytB domain protein